MTLHVHLVVVGVDIIPVLFRLVVIRRSRAVEMLLILVEGDVHGLEIQLLPGFDRLAHELAVPRFAFLAGNAKGHDPVRTAVTCHALGEHHLRAAEAAVADHIGLGGMHRRAALGAVILDHIHLLLRRAGLILVDLQVKHAAARQTPQLFLRHVIAQHTAASRAAPVLHGRLHESAVHSYIPF